MNTSQLGRLRLGLVRLGLGPSINTPPATPKVIAYLDSGNLRVVILPATNLVR